MDLIHSQGQTVGPENGLAQVLRRHSLVFYMLIALGFTWVYELIVYGLLHLPYYSIVGRVFILGPTLAAFIMTAVIEGRAGVLRLLRRYMLWRVGILWYLFVFLLKAHQVRVGVFDECDDPKTCGTGGTAGASRSRGVG